jgi:hypothetical protein
MPIYEITKNTIIGLQETTFSAEGYLERGDLQRLLKNKIDAIAPNTLIITEEFCEWDGSKRRIDLLGLDTDANLVVFELKRTEDGGHMELQAIRYAAMVSTMTFDQAATVFAAYLKQNGSTTDARTAMLQFLGWSEPDEDRFNQDVRIVLVSAEFSKELTTAVLWLNDRDMDIRCVRIKPHKLDDRLLVDVQQVIPLPEAAIYIVQVGKKRQKERSARDRFGCLIGSRRARFNACITMQPRLAAVIASEAGLGENNSNWPHLAKLVEEGLVVETDKGCYALPKKVQ